MSEPAPTPTTEISLSNASGSEAGDRLSPQPAEGNWRRSFWWLNITQFQGAFSTNAFQNLLSYMVLGMGLTHDQRDKMVPLILLFFSVPLVVQHDGGFLPTLQQTPGHHLDQAH
jgi:hypothetical protein